MCAKIGLVTSQGLTGTKKKYYPKPILYIMLLFSFLAIVMNMGADIAGMGAVGNLLFPSVDAIFFNVFFTITIDHLSALSKNSFSVKVGMHIDVSGNPVTTL